MTDAVIVDAVRTASGRGKQGGVLSDVEPVDLLANVLNALVERTGIDPAVIDDVIAGCVNQVGEQALNIARNAVLAAGWPESIPATSLDRQCGSSQQAAHFAAQGVISGAYDVVVACGVESMSRVPMGSSRQGQNTQGVLGRRRYPLGLVNQGVSAELVAARYGISRAQLDEFSVESHQRAAQSQAAGLFDGEIVPVTVTSAGGQEQLHRTDETVRPTTSLDGLAGLKPAFYDDAISERFPEIDWNITPGNSSPLTDGASAVLIMSAEAAARYGLRARARFHSFAVVGDDPIMMLTGPIPATRRVLERAKLSIDDIDTYEVNEAFASVPLAWSTALGADAAKLNPRGGAISLGHALGSSGTRLLTTMVNHLEHTGGRLGLQTMCEGGGMANATIIERI